MNGMIEAFILILILIGTLLSLLSSFGFIRLPDVYTRSHAGTKSVTLGTLSILMATFIYLWAFDGLISVRLLLGIIFVYLTAPVSGHLIARSAYRSGEKLAAISARDDLKRELEREQRQKKSTEPS